MIALLLAAVAVGLSNLAASIGIGVTGVTAKTRLQVSLVFGVFESGMPIVGLLIGQRFASDLGQAVRWPGAILLMVVGAFGLVRSLRDSRKTATGESPQPAAVPATPAVPPSRLGRLLISGFVLSLDNLVVGFALGSTHTSILAGALVIGVVSVGLSLIGLELGRSAQRADERPDPHRGRRRHRRRRLKLTACPGGRGWRPAQRDGRGYSSRRRAAFGHEFTACRTASARPGGTSATRMCSSSSSSTSKTSGTRPAQTAFASQASRSTETFTCLPGIRCSSE